MPATARNASKCKWVPKRCMDPPVIAQDTFCFNHKIEILKESLLKIKVKVAADDHKLLCSHNECTNRSFTKGKCARHSGNFQCKRAGCTKMRQSGGRCKSHGGKHKNSRCKTIGCERFNQGGGRCAKHGGGARCKYEECNRLSLAKVGFCKKHISSVTTNELLSHV